MRLQDETVRLAQKLMAELFRTSVPNAGMHSHPARAHTDEIGCVLEADIYRPDFDFTGVERLRHRPDGEL